MSAFDLNLGLLDRACLSAFGSPSIYRAAGHPDVALTAIPDDQNPEDQVNGQFTVAVVRWADLPTAPVRGTDKFVLDSVEYVIFNYKRLENETMARLFLKK